MNIRDLDDRDRAILRALQQDGRLTNAALAERVNLSPSACLRRVNVLEEEKFIAGYVMLMNEEKAEFASNAFVFVTLDMQGREALETFEAAVARYPEIMECHLLAGTADYLVRVAYSDTKDFERVHRDVLTKLPGVVRVQTTLALRTVKKTTALPI